MTEETQVIHIKTEIVDGNSVSSPKSTIPKLKSDSISTEKLIDDEISTETCEEPTFHVRRAINFYEGDDYYYMLSPIRGNCLIINNIRFLDQTWDREGSEQEGRQLEHLFNQLGFEVKHMKNRTAAEINDDFESVAFDENNKKYDAFVAIILSHGHANNIIEGVDHSLISLDSILDKFNNENCPFLIGKPKMFFIQSCRGDKKDQGVYLQNVADAIGFVPEEMPSVIRLPTWTDTVVCYSTIDGFASMRNILTGSWFGDALIKVFCERAHDTEFNRLISLVNSRLSQREGDINAKQSLELVYRGWCKQLFFNPGLYNA